MSFNPESGLLREHFSAFLSQLERMERSTKSLKIADAESIETVLNEPIETVLDQPMGLKGTERNKHSPFLLLPQEIRLIIYDYLFADFTLSLVWQRNGNKFRRDGLPRCVYTPPSVMQSEAFSAQSLSDTPDRDRKPPYNLPADQIPNRQPHMICRVCTQLRNEAIPALAMSTKILVCPEFIISQRCAVDEGLDAIRGFHGPFSMVDARDILNDRFRRAIKGLCGSLQSQLIVAYSSLPNLERISIDGYLDTENAIGWDESSDDERDQDEDDQSADEGDGDEDEDNFNPVQESPFDYSGNNMHAVHPDNHPIWAGHDDLFSPSSPWGPNLSATCIGPPSTSHGGADAEGDIHMSSPTFDPSDALPSASHHEFASSMSFSSFSFQNSPSHLVFDLTESSPDATHEINAITASAFLAAPTPASTQLASNGSSSQSPYTLQPWFLTHATRQPCQPPQSHSFLSIHTQLQQRIRRLEKTLNQQCRLGRARAALEDLVVHETQISFSHPPPPRAWFSHPDWARQWWFDLVWLPRHREMLLRRPSEGRRALEKVLMRLGMESFVKKMNLVGGGIRGPKRSGEEEDKEEPRGAAMTRIFADMGITGWQTKMDIVAAEDQLWVRGVLKGLGVGVDEVGLELTSPRVSTSSPRPAPTLLSAPGVLAHLSKLGQFRVVRQKDTEKIRAGIREKERLWQTRKLPELAIQQAFTLDKEEEENNYLIATVNLTTRKLVSGATGDDALTNVDVRPTRWLREVQIRSSEKLDAAISSAARNPFTAGNQLGLTEPSSLSASFYSNAPLPMTFTSPSTHSPYLLTHPSSLPTMLNVSEPNNPLDKGKTPLQAHPLWDSNNRNRRNDIEEFEAAALAEARHKIASLRAKIAAVRLLMMRVRADGGAGGKIVFGGSGKGMRGRWRAGSEV